MQVTIENSDALERRVKVEVPEADISAQVQQKLLELSRTIRVDGFRPGKAPLPVVARQYGPRVRGDVLGETLQRTFADAIREHQLRPVGDPVFDPVSAETGAGLAYTATFEVYPEIALQPLDTLTVQKPVCTLGEADVDAMLEVLRKQHANWESVARAAVEGDRLTIDYKGTVDGAELERGSGTDQPLDLGAGRMIEGFEAGLIGATAGETRTLDLTFPDPYHNAELAGKAVRFEVTVKAVTEQVLPTVDAAFAEKFGVTEGGVETFRKEVLENMERERDRALQRRFNARVMEALSAAHEVELPKSLIGLEAQRMHEESRRNLMMRGVNPDQVGHPGPEAFAAPAQERVKRGLLMAEVVRVSGATAQPAKVRAMLETMAAGYEDPEALLKYYYGEPQRLNEIQAVVVEEEAVSWLVAQARVEEEAVSFDDLMNPGQTRASEQSPA